MKEELIEKINNAGIIKGSNRMGVSESFYNPFYLIKKMCEEKNIDLQELDGEKINLMINVADYASEVFY